jgi:hypothetical protein
VGYTLVKLAVSAALIVLISEIARRSTLLGAVVASLPVVSLLAMIWLYVDTGDVARVAAFSREVLVLVIPSLLLFATLPTMLERGVPFVISLLAAGALAAVAYPVVLWVVQLFGWKF